MEFPLSWIYSPTPQKTPDPLKKKKTWRGGGIYCPQKRVTTPRSPGPFWESSRLPDGWQELAPPRLGTAPPSRGWLFFGDFLGGTSPPKLRTTRLFIPRMAVILGEKQSHRRPLAALLVVFVFPFRIQSAAFQIRRGRLPMRGGQTAIHRLAELPGDDAVPQRRTRLRGPCGWTMWMDENNIHLGSPMQGTNYVTLNLILHPGAMWMQLLWMDEIHFAPLRNHGK